MRITVSRPVLLAAIQLDLPLCPTANFTKWPNTGTTSSMINSKSTESKESFALPMYTSLSTICGGSALEVEAVLAGLMIELLESAGRMAHRSDFPR